MYSILRHPLFANVFTSISNVVLVKMMVKAYRVGSEARERVKDLILDDHTQCGCECGEELGDFSRADNIREIHTFSRNFLEFISKFPKSFQVEHFIQCGSSVKLLRSLFTLL